MQLVDRIGLRGDICRVCSAVNGVACKCYFSSEAAAVDRAVGQRHRFGIAGGDLKAVLVDRQRVVAKCYAAYAQRLVSGVAQLYRLVIAAAYRHAAVIDRCRYHLHLRREQRHSSRRRLAAEARPACVAQHHSGLQLMVGRLFP